MIEYLFTNILHGGMLHVLRAAACESSYITWNHEEYPSNEGTISRHFRRNMKGKRKSNNSRKVEATCRQFIERDADYDTNDSRQSTMKESGHPNSITPKDRRKDINEQIGDETN